jgi:hypothetical protein
MLELKSPATNHTVFPIIILMNCFGHIHMLTRTHTHKHTQIAILKVLEKLEELQDGQGNDKRVAIYTDRKITLDLLQNTFKWNRLIEFIRNKMITLSHLKWIVHFGWVKAHAGIEGNELVHRLAKEAAVEGGPVVYDRIPRETIITREAKWTLDVATAVDECGEGGSDQSFFPISEEQITTENSCVPRVYNNGNRTWETKVISPQI